MKAVGAVSVLLLILLSACSKEGPPPPSSDPKSSAEMPAQQPHQAASAPVTVGDASFSITPGSFRICEAPNGAVTSVAKWDVASKGVSEVSIYVINSNGEKKLWLNGGSSGESTTGNWVFPDAKFLLVERGSEKVLGEVTVKATPCN